MASNEPKDGMTVRQLSKRLQGFVYDQDAPVFVIYNDNDGVQCVLGARLEDDGERKIVVLQLENASERGGA